MKKISVKLILQSFSSLVTTFGSNSCVVTEILSHRKDVDEGLEYLNTFNSVLGPGIDADCVMPNELRALPRGESVFQNVEEIYDTVADPDMRAGYYLVLPEPVPIYSNKNVVGRVSKVYIPRGCTDPWIHSSGFIVIPPTAVKANNLLVSCQNRANLPRKAYIMSVTRFLTEISSNLTGKNGVLTRTLFGVQYPHAVRGKALCSDRVRPFNVAMPYHMAQTLGVEPGQYVLGLRYPDLGTSSWIVCKVQELLHGGEYSHSIIVGENSWTSTNLDFDGDTIYLMSLKTRDSNKELEKKFWLHDRRREIIDMLNEKKPYPETNSGMSLEHIDFTKREANDKETYLLAVQGLNAVKLRTAPTVGYLYAIERILETVCGLSEDWRVEYEELFRRIAQMSIGAKHGVTPAFTQFRDAVENIDSAKSYRALIGLGIPDNVVTMLQSAITAQCISVLGKLPSKLKNVPIVASIIKRRHGMWRLTRTRMTCGEILGLLPTIKKHDYDIAKYVWDSWFRNHEDPLEDHKEEVSADANTLPMIIGVEQ